MRDCGDLTATLEGTMMDALISAPALIAWILALHVILTYGPG